MCVCVSKYSEFIDINAAYSHFLQLIISVIDKLAPLKEIRVRNNTQEWMDEEVLEGIRIRVKLLSKFRKTLDLLCMVGSHSQPESYFVIANNSCHYLPKSKYTDLSPTAILKETSETRKERHGRIS